MTMMFSRYVQDKRRRRPLLYASLVVAGVLEGGGLVYFLIASLMNVSELSPPPLYALFLRPEVSLPPAEILPRPLLRPVTPRRRGPTSQLRQPNLNAPPAPPRDAPLNLEPGPPGDTPDPPTIPGDDEPRNPPAPPLPPPDPPRTPIKKVPQFLIKKQQLHGPDPHLPPTVKQQRRGQTVTGTYLICIDKSGRISDVSTLQSIPGADEEIGRTLRTWLYKEQPIPVCFAQHFEFVIE